MTQDRLSELSNLIRTVDGDHSMGAGELAEAIFASEWLAEIQREAKARGWAEGKYAQEVSHYYGNRCMSNPYE